MVVLTKLMVIEDKFLIDWLYPYLVLINFQQLLNLLILRNFICLPQHCPTPSNTVECPEIPP